MTAQEIISLIHEHLDTVVLMLAALCLTLVLISWHKTDDAFDMRQLLVDTATGKVSLFKVGQLVALLTSTWAFIHETRMGHLTEWLFTAYIIAWGGMNIANKMVANRNSTPVAPGPADEPK